MREDTMPVRSRSINGRLYVYPICEVCNVEYEQQARLWRKAVYKARCRAHRYEINPNGLFEPTGKRAKCLDCGKAIWRGSARCKPCSGKKRATFTPKPCADCGCEISRKASSRCLSCWNKKQDLGRSRERTKFNASKKWIAVRTACFERDNYSCQKCGARGNTYLEAHHIKEWCNYPKDRLSLENLITYCVPCHREHHRLNGRPNTWESQ